MPARQLEIRSLHCFALLALTTVSSGLSSCAATTPPDLVDAGQNPVTPSCADGMKNGGETDTDCGGTCATCAAGKQCGVTGDCASKVCGAGRCAAPSCSDGVRNGDETGDDCDPGPVVAADLNGDGRQDLAVGSLVSSEVSILSGLAGGGWGPQTGIVTGARPQSLLAADVDGDRDVDLIAANASGATVSVLRNDGTGTFMVTSRAVNGSPVSLVYADFSGDGFGDIVVTTLQG